MLFRCNFHSYLPTFVLLVLSIYLSFSSNISSADDYIYWEVRELDGYLTKNKFSSALSACGAGVAAKELMNEDLRALGMVWRVPGGFASGGPYLRINGARTPGDVGFNIQAKEIYCNHEYKMPNSEGALPTDWATFWPYSGATIEIKGSGCPLGWTWDEKILGCMPPPSPSICPVRVGNPIDITTGNKYEESVDYSSPTLSFVRYYNHLLEENSVFGSRWSHNFDTQLQIISESLVLLKTAKGRFYRYTNYSGAWTSDMDIGGKLEKVNNRWIYNTKSNFRYEFNERGKLTSLAPDSGSSITLEYGAGLRLKKASDGFGKEISFEYDSSNKLSYIALPTGSKIHYIYDGNILVAVEYPDGTPYSNLDNPRKTYHYEHPTNPEFLTGITDERGIRYATFTYNSDGWAESSTHANNVGRVNLTYFTEENGDEIRFVTNSRGETTNYIIKAQVGTGGTYVSDVMGPGCSQCGDGNTNYVYDDNFNLNKKIVDGRITSFGGYDLNGNPGYKIEVVGTPEQRRTDYTYDSRFQNKLTSITEGSVIPGLSKVTAYGYDELGNKTSVTVSGYAPDGAGGSVAVSRTTTFKYEGPLNQISEIDGPRPNDQVIDITQFIYYSNNESEGNNRGRLKKVIGPEGIILRDNIQYGLSGKIVSEERLNGVTFTYNYYAGSDRFETLTETVSGLSRTTKWTYLPTGEVETITQAYGTELETTVTLSYDDARRLTRISDGVGNEIVYTLDTEGNRIQEDIKDKDGVLYRTLQQTFDAYDRLDTRTLVDEVEDYNFVSNGVLENKSDARKTLTNYSYDALERLTHIVEDFGGLTTETSNTLTQYEYDSSDRLMKVVAPNSAETTYLYDDLDNLLIETGPDRGERINTYDEAGNILTTSDARGIIVSYSYDALNRVTNIDYPGQVEDVSFIYDDCVNGAGQLCQVTDQSGITSNIYDGFGNLVDKVKIEAGVSYATHYDYDLLNRIIKVVTPTGRDIYYQYNSNGQITSIDAEVNGSLSTIVHNALYRPDGMLKNIEFGNGFFEERLYNLKSRLTSVTLPAPYITATELTANAGADQMVGEGEQTFLNGTNSTDPSGVISTYSWSQLSGPTVTLSNTASAIPSFIAPIIPASTSLSFQLMVTNSQGQSATDTVTINIGNNNQGPIANAGNDIIIDEKNQITLDASSSTDLDGSIVTYQWTQIDGPVLPLSNSNATNPYFIAPNVTEDTAYTYKLTVTDNDGAVSEDTVTITIMNIELPFPNIENGTLSMNTTLESGVTYQLSETLTVPAGVTLTLSEGNVLQASGNYQLVVSGTLVVNGTSENPVIFTSGNLSPSFGSWGGITINSTASNVVIDNAIIEYASNGLYFNNVGGTVKNSELRYNNNGIYLFKYLATPLIENNSIHENNSNGIYVYFGASPTITGNQIINNNIGVYARGNKYTDANQTAPVVNNNRIFHNTSWNFNTLDFNKSKNAILDARNNWWGSIDPVYIASTINDSADNTSLPFVDYTSFLNVTGNVAGNHLYVIGSDQTLLANTTYELIGPFTILSGSILAIQEGARVEVPQNYTFDVYGGLNVVGTANNPVIFTSTKINPQSGDWAGLKIYSGATNVIINHAVIEHASTGVYFNYETGSVSNCLIRFSGNGIYTYGPGADPSIQNNSIHDNINGIYTYYGASPVAIGNEIFNNSVGINAGGNKWSNSPQTALVANNNRIYNNTTWNYRTFDYISSNSWTLDATNNWWGSTDHVQIAATINDASDDASLPYVDFSGFHDDNGVPVPVNHLYSVPEDRTLFADTTYQLIGSVRVQAGATLTIQQGARIEVPQNYKLEVVGNLDVIGTGANPVVFTSSQPAPQTNDWEGIVVNDVGATVSIENAIVEYANFGVSFKGVSGALKNSTLRYNNYAIYARDPGADPLIENNQIHDNTSIGIYTYNGASPNVTANTIINNDIGIYARGNNYSNSGQTALVVNNNSIYGNTTWNYSTAEFFQRNNWTLDVRNNWWGTTDPVVIASTINDAIDNDLLPVVDFGNFLDSSNGISVGNYLIGVYPDSNNTLSANQVYKVIQDVRIPPGSTLTIPEGTVIDVADNQLIDVYGTLIINGVENNPAIFTSADTIPAVGAWSGIRVDDAASPAQIDYAVIEYAVNGIYLGNSTGTITNSEIRYNTNGIYAYNELADVTVSQCYLHDNVDSGIVADQGARISVTNNEIVQNGKGISAVGRNSNSGAWDPVIIANGNNIYNNTTNYFTESYYNVSAILDASGNWWGSTDTATIELSIVDSNDDAINLPTVDYSGYLTTAAATISMNIPPVANAGVDKSVTEGATVVLDANPSSDVDGSISSDNWVQIAGPTVELSDNVAISTSFAAPLVVVNTTLTFELTVTDDGGAQSTDRLNIVVENFVIPPTANAGSDLTVNENSVVSMLGGGSDSDGSITALSWTQLTGPVVAIANANQATASFSAPMVTFDAMLTFQLTATDNDGAIGADIVNVLVKNVNAAPVANAGVDQIVSENTAVTLNGGGTDSDGSITAQNWTQISGPTVALANSNTISASFVAPGVSSETLLTFQLTVTDNDDATAIDTVNVSVHSNIVSPIANAGIDQSVTEGSSVELAGSGSDADGTISNYSWTQTTGTPVTLNNSNTATPGFVAPQVTVDEVMTFQLVVTDNDNATGVDVVSVLVQNVNQLPTANAGVDQATTEASAVNLSGSGTDTDGSIDSYAWVQLAGTPVILANSNTANTSFTAPEVIADETLVLELTVTDNNGATAVDTINVLVKNNNQLPVANAGPDQNVFDGDLVTLDGSGSFDSDGIVASYSWVQTAGPLVQLSSASGSATDFTAPAVSSDINLSFELMITDELGATATASVDVLVQPISPSPAADNYYILSSRMSLGGISVVSLIDGNTITAGNTTLALNQYEQGTIPAVDLVQGTKISANGPFDIGSTVNGTDMPVPQAFAGTEFVVPHYRNSHTYFLLSPDADATVDIEINGSISTVNLTQGVVNTFAAGSTNSISGVISSDQPILVAHVSGANDAFAIPPATLELVGIRTTISAVGAAQDNTSVMIYASDGSSTSVVLNRGEYASLSLGNNAGEGQGNAIHIVADKPIAALQAADTDGSEATAYMSPSHFATRFALPVNTQYVAASCLDNSVEVTLTNDANPPQTKICTSDGLTPGKVFFGSLNDGVYINTGAVIESTAPIFAMYEESSNNDEHNLLGNVSEQATPMAVNIQPGVSAARTLLATENKNVNNSILAVVSLPTNDGRVRYRVWRKGPETNEQWIATAEDPNAYDRPQNVLYLTEEALSVWKNQDGRTKLVEQQTISGEPQMAKILAQFQARNSDMANIDRLIKVHQGGTAPTGDTINSEIWSYTYDANGNIEDITTSAGIKDYTYDALNRVTDDVVTGDLIRSYDYDRNGNRTRDIEGSTTSNYGYIINSNKLDTNPQGLVQHDAAGNRTSDRGGNRTFEYNNAGRLYKVYEGGQLIATYMYNAQGQRTRKTTQTGTVVYHYDLAGNLLSETTEAGAPMRDYVFMNSVPVAQIDTDGTTDTISYLHTDHLGTPRRATDAAGDVVWSWDSDAFGKAATHENPDGDNQSLTVNLRFAGQYYDTETTLHYNYFRYYDPNMGRYVTSDPIGLRGGLNTYGYVGGNPLNSIDIFGLLAEVIVFQPVGQGASSFGHTVTNLNGMIHSFGPNGMHIEPIHLYMARNNFRSATGYTIPLTTEQEEKLDACLSSYNSSYSFPNNNCTDPLQSCLQLQGLPLQGVFGDEVMTPAGLLYSIPLAFPGGQFTYYPAIR